MVVSFQIALVILFTYLSALIDCEHIEKEQYIKSHRSRFLLRLTVFIMIGIENPIYMIAGGLMFAALFDSVLNLIRGLPLFYLGPVAKWDVFFNKHRLLYKIFKVLLMALSLMFYFNNIKYNY